MKLYYKGTDENLCCKGFQYEVGKTYKVDNPCICVKGFHACEEPEEIFKFDNWKRFLIVTGVLHERLRHKVCLSEMTVIKEVDIISFLSKERPIEFDWKRHSWAVAQYRPDMFDPDKYDWAEHSWAIAQYCPSKLDPERYNWERYSWHVARYCPSKLDPERYNWKEYSWAVRMHCPN